MSKIYTAKLSDEQRDLVLIASRVLLRHLQIEAMDSDYQAGRDRAEKEIPIMKAAIEELQGARCYLEESKV